MEEEDIPEVNDIVIVTLPEDDGTIEGKVTRIGTQKLIIAGVTHLCPYYEVEYETGEYNRSGKLRKKKTRFAKRIVELLRRDGC